MSLFKLLIISLSSLLFLSSCSKEKTRYIEGENLTGLAVKYVEIIPSNIVVPINANGTYKAIAHYSDDSTEDVSRKVEWTTTQESIVSIVSGSQNPGYAQALDVGSSTIQARYDGSVSNTSVVSVTDLSLDSIQLTPQNSSVSKGIDIAYTAIGLFSDGQTSDITAFVNFVSSDTSVGTIDSNGLASTLKVGLSNITASYLSITSNSAALEVTTIALNSIQITPASTSVAKGTSGTYLAIGTFSDNTQLDLTRQVTWSSSATNIVSIDNTLERSGYAQAINEGNATIGASFLNVVSNDASVEVTNATLTSLIITPTTSTTPLGISVAYSAIGIFSDSSFQDLTAFVLWNSSNTNVATIDSYNLNAGNTNTLSAGTTTITATYDSVESNTASLSVTAAVITYLEVRPEYIEVEIGTQGHYIVMAHYSDRDVIDVTSSATWVSLDPSVVNIETSGTNAGSAVAIGEGVSIITASFDGLSSNHAAAKVTPASLVSISLSPLSSSVANGVSVNYLARGLYTDGSNADITSFVDFNSSNIAVADFESQSADGIVSSYSVGQTTITAMLSGVISNDANLTVSTATITSITITPTFVTMADGSKRNYYATALYSDGLSSDVTRDVNWISANKTIVTIKSNTLRAGLARGEDVGSTTIRATLHDVTANVLVTSNTAIINITAATLQEINLSPPLVSVANGVEQIYTAIGIYSDGSNQDITASVTYTSDTPEVGTVSAAGIAKTHSVGAATITASASGITSNDATLNVSVGTLSSIQVTPGNSNVAMGLEVHYTATGYFTDGETANITNSVVWTSADQNVLSIVSFGSNAGIARGENIGNTIVTANAGTIVSNNASVKVSSPILDYIQIYPNTQQSVAKGETFSYIVHAVYSDLTYRDVTANATWSSSNDAIASIESFPSLNAGLVYSYAEGTVSITAFYQSKQDIVSFVVTEKTVTSVQITPADKTVPLGTTGNYVATAYYSDNTSSDVTATSTWTSSAPSIVNIVANTGYATSLAQGSATISAIYNTVASNDATVEVLQAALVEIQLDPKNQSIALGLNMQYSALGIYSDASNLDISDSVSWSSSDTAKATMDTLGLASSLAEGTVSITANKDGISSSTSLNINPATLISLEIDRGDVVGPKGSSLYLKAVGIYSDDSTPVDITDLVTWISLDSNIVSVVVGGTDSGLAQFLTVGTTAITASFDDKNDTINAEVVDAVVEYIQVSPINESVAVGLSMNYLAYKVYTDGTSSQIVQGLTWSSSDTALATISANGEAVGVSSGSVTIRADYLTLNDETLLEVSPPVFSYLKVDPPNTSLALGLSQDYVATAIFSNGDRSDVTSSALWTSSDELIALVNTGIATTLAEGNTTITAAYTYSGVSLSENAALEVVSATLQSIDINTNDSSQALGGESQYRAIGIYSDGGGVGRDITEEVTWFSQTQAVADVSNIAGTRGLVSAISEGNTTIVASLSSINSNSSDFEVTPATLESIRIEPLDATMSPNTTQQYRAEGTYNNGEIIPITGQVAWTSSSATIAQIDVTGLATAIGDGTTTIRASLDGVDASTSLRVGSSITGFRITPLDDTIANETDRQFNAYLLVNGVEQDVTATTRWASSNTDAATIDTAGLALGDLGRRPNDDSTSISAEYIDTDRTVWSDTTTLYVLDLVNKPNCAVIIDNPNIDTSDSSPVAMSVNEEKQFYYIGIWTANNNDDCNGTTPSVHKQDMTNSIYTGWGKSDRSILDVNNAFSKGRVRAKATGTADIEAGYGWFSSVNTTRTINVQ